MNCNNCNSKKCKCCGKPIVPIGNNRKNGRNHDDWSTRVKHKKCRDEWAVYNYDERDKAQKNENNWKNLRRNKN